MPLDLFCKQIGSEIIYLEGLWRIGNLKKGKMAGIVSVDYVLGENTGTEP